MQDLQQQSAMLQKEYEYEKELYRQQTREAGIPKRIQQGVCWFPVKLGADRYNSLNQLTVEVTRTETEETEHSFEYGRPVCFFRISADRQIRYFNFSAVISYVQDNKMVVVLPGPQVLPELVVTGELGVQLYFDDTSYKTMFAALREVAEAKGNRTARLREVLLGKAPALRRETGPVRFPWLNASQEKAVNQVLCAKEVAVVHGPPGTGKTLLAKALAGEAGVPFFSLSGSDFVEMFVGVGASRVRDLFKQATSMAPCIIFIDEIDAIGKSRDSQYGGGNDEREQTLNQLLSEMDGFDSSKGIIILGATNRPEVLDKALLRPGRFDRRIIVEKPDLKGRVDVLKVHSHDVLMDDTVDLEEIALATSGAVGADLANMVNEAAIMAVKDGRQVVSQKDLFEAVEVVLAGKEKKDRILGEEEKKIVAYHEIGHALVATNLKHAEPVQKITIVPRTMGALGYVMQVPEEEKYLMKKEELISEIVTLMGGRAAEQVKFDDITTGASNDIEKATSIARSMVTQYGMSSKFGMMGLETIQSRYLDGRPVLNCGEVTESQIDEEVMTILNDCYKKAVECIETNQTVMDKLAEHLIEKETITGKEFVAIYEEITGEKLKRSGEEKQKEEVKELPQNEEE